MLHTTSWLCIWDYAPNTDKLAALSNQLTKLMCLSDVWRVNVTFSVACSYIQHLSFGWCYKWHVRIQLMAGFDPVLLVRVVFYYWPTRDIFCEATSTNTLPPWRLRWSSCRTGPTNGGRTFSVLCSKPRPVKTFPPHPQCTDSQCLLSGAQKES